jgi:peptidoglycan/xylan/chitin deacetylase (PgdA/CDA1 family)
MHKIGNLINKPQRLIRGFFSTATILLYHRVAKVTSDPQLLCVSPEHFAEHLEVIQKHFCPMRLQHLAQSLQNGDLCKRAIAITFDDGYVDNLFNGQPLLEKYSVPATIYVATGYIGGQRAYWWDELDRLVLQPDTLPDTLDLNVNGRMYQWELGMAPNHSRKPHLSWSVLDKNDSSPRQRLYSSLCELIRPLSHKERHTVLDQLREWAKVDVGEDFPLRVLSSSEILQLDEGGLVEIGAHTVNHPVLSKLLPDDQREEIKESKKHLEAIVGHSIASFAYPYGTRGDYSSDTVNIVRETGFANACSNFSGAVWRGSDHFQLPRFVVRDWDGDEFAAKLEEWLRG